MTDKDKVTQIIHTIIGKDRVESLDISEKLTLTYRRDGLSPIEKREKEAKLIRDLGGFYSDDSIFLKTISERSDEVYKSIPKRSPEESTKPKDPAQLQVGHGTMAPKKKIEGVKHIIAIASGKGGVGKSTFAVNLAKTLADQGNSVGIVDADIYGPSIPMLLNQRKAVATSNSEKKIIPVEAYGMKFISFGLFVRENDPVIWRGPMLGGVLNQFFFDVDWRGTDYLIIDLPPGTGDVQLSMVQAIELTGAVIISTPQDVAFLDANRALEMFKKLNIPVLGLVENMSQFICSNCGTTHDIFGAGTLEKEAVSQGTTFLGAIPLESKLRESADSGAPFMGNSDFSKTKTWESYQKISNGLTSLKELN